MSNKNKNCDFLPFPGLQNPYNPELPKLPWAPLGGYSLTAETEMASVALGKTQQLFTSLSLTNFPPDNSFYSELVTSQLLTKSEIIWIVTVNAIQTTRSVSEGTVPYLKTQQIYNIQNNFPPRYSCFQARIRYSDGSAMSHTKYIDIKGGKSFLVFARGVSVDILCPNPTYLISNGSQNPETTNIPQLSGVVIDAIISARIAPQVVPKTGCDYQEFTKRIDTEGAEGPSPGFVEIPPGAKAVKIYNCTIGGAPTEMYFWIGTDAALGYTQGIIDFTGDSTIDYQPIPAMATHIYTGPTNNGQFTFVFQIDP